MSTIAIDGEHVVGDGLRVAGYRPTSTRTEKIRVKHGRIYAITGYYAMFDALIAWHNDGADPGKLPPIKDNDAWSLLVVDRYGAHCFNNNVPYGEEEPLPFAIGSGSDWAVAAMNLGKSAEEAVRFAALNDVYTGGEIQVVNIAEALRAPIAEAAE